MRFFIVGAASIALLFPHNVLAQCNEVVWHHHIHGIEGGNAAAWPNLSINPSNGKLLVGATAYNVDELSFGSLTNSFIDALGGNSSLYMGLVNPDGSSEWVQSFNNDYFLQSEDVCATDDGGYFLIGAFNPNFVGQDTTVLLTPNTGNGYFMYKVDEAGELEWIRHAQNGFSAVARAVAIGSDILVAFVFTGEFEIGTQSFQSDGPERDLLLIRFSSDGDVIWTKHVTGSGSMFIEDLACFSGTCVVQGRFNETIDFDGQTLMVPSNDLRAFQFGFSDVDGEFMWKKKVTTAGANGNLVSITGSVQSGQDKFVVVGTFNTDILEIDGLSITNHGTSDAFIASQRISNGELVWLKSFGGVDSDQIFGISMTNTGVALGATTKSATIDYEGFNYIHANAGNDHPLVLLLDGDGKPLCSSSSIAVEGTANIVDLRCYNGGLYCLSGFIGQFESDGVGSTSVGTRDLVVWKTCLPCDTLTSIAETQNGQPSLNLYPNPAGQAVRVEVTTNRQQLTAITITDMLGHAVLNSPPGKEGSGVVNTQAQSKNHEYLIDISRLANGLYVLRANLENGEEMRQRLVVQH